MWSRKAVTRRGVNLRLGKGGVDRRPADDPGAEHAHQLAHLQVRGGDPQAGRRDAVAVKRGPQQGVAMVGTDDRRHTFGRRPGVASSVM